MLKKTIWLLIPVMFALLTFFQLSKSDIEIDEEEYYDEERPDVFVDSDYDATDIMQSLEKAFEQKRWKTVLELIQRVQSKYGSKLYQSADNTNAYLGIRQQCLAYMRKIPFDEIAAYRQNSAIDAAAKTLLNNAQQSHNISALKKVAYDYFISSYSDDALDKLGDVYFEEGYIFLASLAWEYIIKYHPDPDIDIPTVKLKITLAKIMMEPSNTLKIIESFKKDHPDIECTVNGQKIKAAKWLADNANKITGIIKNDLAETPAHTEIKVPLKTWAVDFINADLREIVRAQLINEYRQQGWHIGDIEEQVEERLASNNAMMTIPVIYNNTIYFVAKGMLRAIDMVSGAEKQIFYSSTNIDQRIYYNSNEKQSQMTATIDKGRYFSAALGRQNKKILCYDFASEKFIMAIAPPNEQQFFSEAIFTSKPLQRYGTIYATAGRISNNQTELYICAFDAETGMLKNKLMLCSIGGRGGYYSLYQMESHIFEAEGRLYIMPNFGMIDCVDCLMFDHIWAMTYKSSLAQNQRGIGMQSWDNNPIFLQNGTLVVAPSDSRYLYTLEASTGKKLWEPLGNESYNKIIAVINDIVYLSGSNISAYDLNSGEIIWHCPIDDEEQPGTPTLIDGIIYLPTAKKLLLIDCKSGKVSKQIAWPNRQNKAGTAIVMKDTIIHYTTNEIECFTDNNFLAELRNKIEKNPDMPEPYFQIAQIYEYQGMHALALQKYMTGYEKAGNNKTLAAAFESKLHQICLRNAELADTLDDKIKNYIEALKYTASETQSMRTYWRLAATYEKKREWEKLVYLYQETIRNYSHLYTIVDGESLPAAEYAKNQIDKIIEKVTRTPYEKLEAEARELLKEGLEKKNILSLQKVIWFYPNSTVVNDALMAVGQLQMEEKNYVSAIDTISLSMRRLENQKADPASRLLFLAQLLECYKNLGIVSAQYNLYQEISEKYPDKPVPSDPKNRTGKVFAADGLKQLVATDPQTIELAEDDYYNNYSTRIPSLSFPVTRKWSLPLDENNSSTYVINTGNIDNVPDSIKNTVWVSREKGVIEARNAQTGELQWSANPNKTSHIGINISNTEWAITGIQIGAVYQRTPAELSGIKPGDIITSINGKPMTSVEEFYLFCAGIKDEKYELNILRQGKLITLPLILSDKTKNVSLATSTNSDFIRTVFIERDRLIVCRYSELSAYNISDGKFIWSVPLHGRGGMNLVRKQSGYIYGMVNSRELLVFDAYTGIKLWDRKISKNDNNGFNNLYMADNIIGCSQQYPSTRIFAYDILSGTKVYEIEIGFRNSGRMLVFGKKLLILGGRNQNSLQTYDITTGKMIWDFTFGQHIYYSRMLAANDKHIFVAPQSRIISIIDSKTGILRLQANFAPNNERYDYRNCVMDNESAYVLYVKFNRVNGVQSHAIANIDLVDGSVKWTAELENGFYYYYLSLTKGHLVIRGNDMNGIPALVALDNKDGKITNAFGLPKKKDAKDPAVPGNGNDKNEEEQETMRNFIFTHCGVAVVTDKQIIFYASEKKK